MGSVVPRSSTRLGAGRTHEVTLTCEAFSLDAKVSGTFDGILFG
ncbi:hypothetical protein ACIBHY_51650 [Nonomuraea sp. NPDC050547]